MKGGIIDSHRRDSRVKRIARLLFVTLVSSLVGSASAGDLPGGIRLKCQVSPSRLKPGDQAELSVTVELPVGWIIYDLEQVPNSVLPTTLDVDPIVDIAPLETFRSSGAQEERDPKFRNRLVRFFPISPTFRRPLRVSADARPGERQVTGRIGFLAQYLLTKRFYIVSRADFGTTVLIDPPPAPASSEDKPEGVSVEQEVTTEQAAALLAPEPPRPPVPPFHIVVNTPAPPRRVQSVTGIPWNVVMLVSIILTTVGVASGVLTPPITKATSGQWLDLLVR
jgi:hypothetical protein